MKRTAVVSECGLYRFTLTREWTQGSGRVCWVMLNPSTADGEEDDPTIRKCVGFSTRWGYQSLEVVNLFGLRATDPRVVKAALRAATTNAELAGVTGGGENDAYLKGAVERSQLVILAWGAQPWAEPRAKVVSTWVHRGARCLGRTKSGSPRHPLMVAYRTTLQGWP